MSKDRFGLVTIHGIDYQIVDIGMRMLTPRELYAAQGAPADYIIDHDYTGHIRKTSKLPVAEIWSRALCESTGNGESSGTVCKALQRHGRSK